MQGVEGLRPFIHTRKKAPLRCFFQLYSPYGELYASTMRDIAYGSDMRFARFKILKANIISANADVYWQNVQKRLQYSKLN